MDTIKMIIKNKNELFALICLCLIAMYITFAICRERPMLFEHNYIADYTYELELNSDNNCFEQGFNIFSNDRRICSVTIYVNGNIYEQDAIRISIYDDLKIQTVEKKKQDVDKGEIVLPFDWSQFDENQNVHLKIELCTESGKINIRCTKHDLMGTSTSSLSDQVNETIAIDVNAQMNCKIWDYYWFYFLIIYAIIGILVLTILRKKRYDIKIARLIFILTCFMNIICLILIYPSFLDTCHIAENSLNFYYLTAKFSTAECLFKADAGYLPLLQRIVAIICIKILKLGVDSLSLMQLIAIGIDIIFISAINLYTFRMNIKPQIRFALSICIMLLYIHPFTSTYFNFVYMGYLFILLLVNSNLNELKKYQYMLLSAFSGIICASKGFFLIWIPVGILCLLMSYKTENVRKIIYLCILVLSASIEFAYAFTVGNGIEKWLGVNNISTKYLIYLVAFLSILITFSMIVLRRWYSLGISLRKRIYYYIMNLTLCLGSFAIPTIAAFKKIYIKGYFDWRTMWYVPSAMALFLLLGRIASDNCLKCKKNILNIIAYSLLMFMIVSSIMLTRGKLYYSDKIVPWKYYKDFFDNNIVPVFVEDQRFGTLADGHTIYYTNKCPEDNYYYGAPYNFEQTHYNDEDIISEIIIDDNIFAKGISAVYLNYASGVGNQQLKLLLFDEQNNKLGELQQISPLYSKLVGFVSNALYKNVYKIKVVDNEGNSAYITSTYYIITIDND